MGIFKRHNFRHPCSHLLLLYFLIDSVSAVLDFPASRAELSARSLDALLQERAFRALLQPKTGIPYDGNVPPGMAGIGVSALRLRSGAMRRKGFRDFHEFTIPAGMVAQPYAERIVLVYHNLGNWSGVYYPLPEGYIHLTPVLGLMAYDASNLSASGLPELELRASETPMLIKFSRFKPAPASASPAPPKCVFFDMRGSLEFDIVADGNICRGTKQGHFSMVVEIGAPGKVPAATIGDRKNSRDKKGFNKLLLWVILGTTIGGVVMLCLLILVLVCAKKGSGGKEEKKKRKMEEALEREAPLPTTAVRLATATVASKTRTRPVLDDEYTA
ncbi:unnamed protein product [Cuscuta epithymum]|uniref:Uncharacterized protein n=1 Tax=Cuscuta epithymum TaxID=186058 RepID=A0AAV0CHN3_9ASTE|nr:unnamed protein product [Cuscuta epithymum]